MQTFIRYVYARRLEMQFTQFNSLSQLFSFVHMTRQHPPSTLNALIGQFGKGTRQSVAGIQEPSHTVAGNNRLLRASVSLTININRPIGMVKYHYYSSSCISRDFKITSTRLCNKLYVECFLFFCFFLVDNFY